MVVIRPLASLAEARLEKESEQMLAPFWVECVDAPGVGITAQSEAEARALFAVAFGIKWSVARVSRITAASELDQMHVVQNVGNWLKRGIWYPRGFEDVTRF